MFIHEIEIENFRSIKHLKLNDLSNINIFYGNNNVGKSNILLAIDTFFRTIKQISNRGTFSKILDRKDFYNCDTTKPIRIRIKFSINRKTIDTMINYYSNRTPDEPKKIILVNKKDNFCDMTFHFSEGQPNGYISVSIEEFKINTTQLISGHQILYEKQKDKTQLNSSTLFQNQTFINTLQPLISYFRVIPWYRVIEPEFIKLPSSINYIEDESYTTLLFNLKNHKEKKYQDLFRKISNDFKAITDTGQITMGLDHVPSDNVQKDYTEIYVIDQDKMIPLRSLGSSAQQLLAVLTYYHMFNNNVIGLEEPEIHLSPKSQEEFRDYLISHYIKDKGNRQIFITTHSPTYAEKGNVIKVGYDSKIKSTVIDKQLSDRIETMKDDHWNPTKKSLLGPSWKNIKFP